jgi:hypothetical protein
MHGERKAMVYCLFVARMIKSNTKSDKSPTWSGQKTAATASGLVPIFQTIYLWQAQISIGLSAGGLPVSDNTGWTSCIKSLALLGTFPNNSEEFCTRRPIYPLLASLLYKLAPSDYVLQLLLSTFFGLSLFLFTIKFGKKHNFFAGVSISLLFSLLWFRWAASQNMTESLGLILGVLLAAHSMEFFETSKAKNYCYLLSLLLISVRPGNFFLPVIFAILIPLTAIHLKRINRVYLGIVLLTLSFITDKILSFTGSLNGYSNFNNGGNLWSVLYGLSDKNQPWNFVYQLSEVKFAENEAEIWAIVQRLTLENFVENPFNIFINIGNNIIDLFKTQIPFFFPLNLSLTQMEFFLYALISFLLILTFLVWLIKFKHFSVEVFFWISIILSTMIAYGVGWKSDPLRTMSPYQPLTLVAYYSLFLPSNGPIKLLTFKGRAYAKKQSKLKLAKRKEEKEMIHKFSLKNFCLTNLGGLTFFGLLLFMPLYITSAEGSQLTRMCKSSNTIQLIPETIDYRHTSTVNLLNNYWWSEQIKELRPGYLIQGLATDRTFYNLYLPSNSRYLFNAWQNNCFVLIPDSANKLVLESLSYIQVSLP